jgi:DNA-binding NtrC family response regulator
MTGITRRAQIQLTRHSWPGNIRELENVLGHACMMAMGDMIDVEDLPRSLWGPDHQRSGNATAATSFDSSETPTSFEDREKELLANALEQSGGNQSEAARILRISRDRMRYKMTKHNLR